MKVVKRKILQALTTGTVYGTGSTKIILPDGYHTKPEEIYLGWTGDTGGEGTVIIPDLNVVYNIKISLTSEIKDIGFFDAYDIEPPLQPSTSPEEEEEVTYYYLDFDGSVFTDSDGASFVWHIP